MVINSANDMRREANMLLSKGPPLFLVACLFSLTGCASLGAAPQQSNTLVTAVTSLTQAESDLYDQLISVSRARQRMAFERAFVTKDLNSADATAAAYEKAPPEGYERAKALRLQVLVQLGNYAQQINAIATSASTAWPAAAANTTVTDTEKLVTTLYPGAKVSPEVDTAKSVINNIAAAVVNARSASEIQKLAGEAEPAIESIQTMIDNDNEIIVSGIVQGLIPAQQIDGREIVKVLYDQPGSPLARLQLVQTLGTLVPPPTTLLNKQQLVTESIKKIVGANQALAIKKNQNALQLIDEAVAAANLATAAAPPASTKK
jgi:hypothetical protein